ncbi:hypothetical protein AGMMS49975_24400 [Clostridia bacterium]|nr:hypothetical protein AGMMS49975_24400 [Clostridia bacterium]
MVLDLDCARNLLVVLEGTQFIRTDLSKISIPFELICKNPCMVAYSNQTIAYVTEKLKEADFIDVNILYVPNLDGSKTVGKIVYYGLTYEGHQYLSSVKSDKVWEKMKTYIGEVGGDFAFSVIKTLSAKIIGNLLSV